MYDFYYQRLLNDPTKFAPRDGNRYLEIWDPGDGLPISCEEGDLPESQMGEWLYKELPPRQLPTTGSNWQDRRSQGLRLLIGSPEEHENDAKILPLPFSAATFEEIRTAWELPTELLRMMLSTLPISTDFSSADKDGRLRTLGLMIRGGRSRDWNYCLALSFDLSTRVTRAIVQGLEEHEIGLLRTCLKSSQEHVSEPLLLPLFLTELKIHFFAVLLERRALSLEEIEYETGMKHGFSEDPRRNPALNSTRSNDLTKLDFGPITQKLTSFTGTLAFCELTFESSLRCLELVTSTTQKLLDHRSKRTGSDVIKSPDGALHRRAVYLKGLISGAQAHRLVLTQRTRAQVQTVYSMIGQRDNRLNIETAAASRKIAEASLQDNAIMKNIAEDSRNVAWLSRRDSTHMRIIAAVTLVFLPGTFAATLFSTTFFNFQIDPHTGVVSWWIWLYFVVTVGLTLLTLGGWYFVSRKQNKTVLQALDGEKERRRTWAPKLEVGAPESPRFSPIQPLCSPTESFLARRTTSIGRIAEEGPYGMNDAGTRFPMTGINSAGQAT